MTLPGTLLRAKNHAGLRYDFYAWGVVAYADGTREVMRARLADVVSGTVDASGIWLATSTTGVWQLGLDFTGDATDQLRNLLSVSTATPLQSNACNWIDSSGGTLLVATDAGIDFVGSNLSAVYSFVDGSGCARCAIDATRIAYTPSSGGIHYRTWPTADWVAAGATVLTTASTPAILSNTVKALEFATDLFIATASGISVYNGSAVSNITPAAANEATGIVTNVGTPTGTLANTFEQDASYYQVAEVTGAPGFEVLANVAGVSTAVGSLNIYGRYQGNVAHTVNVDVWNYTTSSWQTLGTLAHATSDAMHTFTLTDANHRSGELVQVRIQHTSSGSVGHNLYIDHLYLAVTASAINDVRALHPTTGANRTTGHVAIGTANDSDGGICAIYDIAGSSYHYSSAGDVLSGIYADDDLQLLICDDTLTELFKVEALFPGFGSAGVRRDWSIYAEVTDLIGGISSLSLEVNGSSVSPTITAIGNGYMVEYSPASASGYQARITCKMTIVDGTGDTIVRTWSFTTEELPEANVSNTAIPNVTCYRDISLNADEADEVIGSVRVIYLDDYINTLIVEDAQAQAVGKVLIDENTYHKRIRSIRVPLTDSNGDDVKDLQKGDIVTLHCPAIGMNNKPCEVMTKQRQFNNKNRSVYILTVFYYEAV